jgi:hypothetical protein
VNSRRGFQPRVARLKSTKIVNRASRGSRFYPFVELTLKNCYRLGNRLLPPVDEPKAIVEYLESETARIDEAIANMKQQIADCLTNLPVRTHQICCLTIILPPETSKLISCTRAWRDARHALVRVLAPLKPAKSERCKI